MLRSEDSDQAIDLNVEPESSVPCSICLDLVNCGGERSITKLKCGHEFHLDCIGSAFNMKGVMQCPNCREIEKGRWLYASGSSNSSPEPGMDDGSVDNFPFYFTFSEMPYGVQICPFRGFTQVHPSSQLLQHPSLHTSESIHGPNHSHFHALSSQDDTFSSHASNGFEMPYPTWGFQLPILSAPRSQMNEETGHASGPPVISGAGLGELDMFSESRSAYAISSNHRSSLGVMSSLTPMITHQHLGAGSPHPHGWVQFQQTSYLHHHHHQASGLPMPISSGVGRFDTQRSMPRFVPSGRVYDPNPGFSHFAESSPVNYSPHAWSRDNVPHFPMP